MKTVLLITIAAFLVLIPWVRGLDFGINNEVMVDGFTVSSAVVMTLTLVFSLVSWLLLSWASKNIKVVGIPLSAITAVSIMLPFSQTLGPMASIIVGVVAGFAAFMIQKKMTCPTHNRSLITATLTLSSAYAVLILMILAAHADSMGNGIGEWTGTAEGMEETGFDNVFNNSIEFIFFLVVIPSLMVTGLIIQGKTISSKFLIILGTALMIEGLLVTLYLSLVLLPSPAGPPIMRPIEGIDFIFVMYRQAFWFSGMMGIFVTLIGVIAFWRKRK